MNWFQQWKLRRAQERYAYWKGRREMIEKQLCSDNLTFRWNPHNRDRVIRAAGKEAQFMERVEILMRQ